MKTTRVFVPWQEGLHARAAAQLVRRIRDLRSRVRFRAGPRVADGRSILSLLALCAPRDTAIEIEVSGDDEDAAVDLIASLFTDAKHCEGVDGEGDDQPCRPERTLGARTSAVSRTGGTG
jgi:phosphotransferase system HPr (HPr) family protein